MNVRVKNWSVVLFLVMLLGTFSAMYADSLEVYTPYTSISITPGSSVSYAIDVINNGAQTCNAKVSVSSLPHSWDYSMMAGGLNVAKLAVLPNTKKTLSLKVNVPYSVRKGYYNFVVKAGDNAQIPLTINVTSAGSSVSELLCDQKNMEGNAETPFSFNAVLKNITPKTQQYALMANALKGWRVTIKTGSKQATSTEVDANGTKNISYTIVAPHNVKAGTYKIPVKAVSGNSTAQLELEVVVTGSYKMSLSTPSGLLSAHVIAGEEKKVELVIENTGTTDLKDINLSSTKPKNWEVTFDTKTLKGLAPGHTARVYAIVKADKKAIPGDYVCKVKANTSELNETLSFRIMVKTPIIMGWLGILVILLALSAVVFLMRKYGRR